MSLIDRRRWLRASIAFTFAAGFAQPALAQGDPPTAAQDDDGLNTVYVTANRRTENLQDVPLSAATLEADQVQTIFDAGGDVTALAARVPGLFVESSNGRVAPRFYIRGLGNTDFDLAASQPVSVIMDEVVLENVTLKSFPIFDVDRIEVLRGPQGTLFGRNTPAGIVNISTNRPTDQFDARGSLSIGSHMNVAFDGAVGGPIAQGVSARLSVLLQRRSDFIDNGFTGEEDVYGGYTDFAIRGQLLLNPPTS
jgi:iron complex outermembrane recepter protein